MKIVFDGALMRSSLLLVLLVFVGLAGCDSCDFQHAEDMDAERFRLEVEGPEASALVLLHRGDDVVYRLLGPIVDHVASMSLEGLKVYHWDTSRNPNLRSVMLLRGKVAAILVEKGKPVDYIRVASREDEVNRGLFMRLIRRHLIPNGGAGGTGTMRDVQMADFDEKVLKAEHPVVLVFKDESG